MAFLKQFHPNVTDLYQLMFDETVELPNLDPTVNRIIDNEVIPESSLVERSEMSS